MKQMSPLTKGGQGFPLLLLICDSNPFSIVRSFEHALYERVNLATVYLDVQEWFLKKVELPRLLYKLFKVRLERLKALPRDPDIILVVEPYVKTHLDLSRFKDSVKVFYALDPHAPQAKNSYAKCRVSEYDYIFCAQKDYIPMLKELGCSKVHWLPYAVDPVIFREIKGLNFEYDIAFIGSMSGDRKVVLEKLEKKFKMLAAGPGKGAYYMHELATAYSASKIVLQISNRGTLGPRVFEGMACNRLVVADRIGNGLGDFFLDGENIMLYRDVKELEDKVDYYLTNEEERRRIATNGYNLVTSKHTYRHRVMELLSTVLDSNT